MPIPTTAHDSPYEVEPVNLAEVQSSNLLQATPNTVFLLGHHPDNWEIGMVDGEAHWLPEMAQRAVVPGVCMCRTIRKGEPKESAYEGMIAWLAKRGEVIIPMDAIVGDTPSYLARTACQDPVTKRGGYRHFDAWSTPKPTKRGTVKVWRDTNGFNRWRLELVRNGWRRPDGTTGRIPDADRDVIAANCDRVHGHLLRKEAETGLPQRAYEREVKIRREELERLTGAKLPVYVGVLAAPVVDYSAALISMLGVRVAKGEDLAEVLASVPDLTDDIIEAVTAMVPAPKPVTKPNAKAKK